MTSTEQRVQLLIGAQAIQICELQSQLEIAATKIEELTVQLAAKFEKGNTDGA